MAYTGATTPNTGSDSAATLSRDVYITTLQSFYRRTVFLDKLQMQSISGGTGGQFIVEGKEDTDDTNVVSYTSGTQVDVTGSTQDEIIINLDRPQYIARRIDKFEEMTANYEVLAMNLRQIASKLANVVDRKAAAAVEAASLGTGLVGNGDGTIVVNTALPGGVSAATTAEDLGNEIAESIYASVAAIRENDDFSDIWVAMSPTNYQYLPQSSRAANSDFTNGNGGFDSGEVKDVGGAMVFQTTNMPATAGLIALAFTEQSAGVLKLMDVTTKVAEQQDFLDAKLITSYFSNGMGPLRPQSTVSIKNV